MHFCNKNHFLHTCIFLIEIKTHKTQDFSNIEFTFYPSYGPRPEKTCLWGFADNTGADQPAHLRSLISAFVIRFLENFICELATGEISIF